MKLIADRSPTVLRGTNWFLLLHFFPANLIFHFSAYWTRRFNNAWETKQMNICCFRRYSDFVVLSYGVRFANFVCEKAASSSPVRWHHSESRPRLMHCASWRIKEEEILLIWFLITKCDVLLVLVTNFLPKQKKPICLRSCVGDGGRGYRLLA